MSATARPLGSVLVIAKTPVPGRVKTRLIPDFTAQQAADLAAAAIHDTLAAAGQVAANQHVLVLDGAPGPWIPTAWRVIAQCDGGLDLRLSAAFDAVADDGPAILIGMDTPQVRPGDISVFDPARFDAALGLAADGGFWAIGLRDPGRGREVIEGVTMSVAETGAIQSSRLTRAGMTVQILDELVDVDTAQTATQVARLAPHGKFADQLRAIHPDLHARTSR